MIITDDQGKELAVEASSNEFGDARTKLAKLERDDVFDKKYQKKSVRADMGYYYK